MFLCFLTYLGWGLPLKTLFYSSSVTTISMSVPTVPLCHLLKDSYITDEAVSFKRKGQKSQIS